MGSSKEYTAWAGLCPRLQAIVGANHGVTHFPTRDLSRSYSLWSVTSSLAPGGRCDKLWSSFHPIVDAIENGCNNSLNLSDCSSFQVCCDVIYINIYIARQRERPVPPIISSECFDINQLYLVNAFNYPITSCSAARPLCGKIFSCHRSADGTSRVFMQVENFNF